MEYRQGALEDLGLRQPMTPGFWQGKRVFLTGHTGFKGSWLSLWLESLGARVKGYALEPPTVPALFSVARVAGAWSRRSPTFATCLRFRPAWPHSSPT